MLAESAYGSAIVLAGVFLASGLFKLSSVGVFREQLADYKLMPYGLTRTAAPVLAAAEVVATGLLVAPQTTRVGAALAGALLGLFTAAGVITLLRGRDISCACFGTAAVGNGMFSGRLCKCLESG